MNWMISLVSRVMNALPGRVLKVYPGDFSGFRWSRPFGPNLPPAVFDKDQSGAQLDFPGRNRDGLIRAETLVDPSGAAAAMMCSPETSMASG
jgi:hypothetical protein